MFCCSAYTPRPTASAAAATTSATMVSLRLRVGFMGMSKAVAS
jgi:hypothetical protein